MDASGPDKNPPFEVFFDGQCPLCRREIDMIRRMDRRGRLILTDIASDSFEPESVPLDQLMREIHGRVVGGPYVTGVEVFRQIYQRVGWGAVVGPTRWPVVRSLLDGAYRVFAALRYRHALHRLKNREQDCDACQVARPSSPTTSKSS